jgi:hypothetical protein
MTVAIEDAGFEVRDSIHWVYGSGFPKSLDVSKAIDKQRHDRAEVYEVTAWVRAARDAIGVTNAQIDAAFGFSGMAGHWTSSASQPAIPTLEQVPSLLEVLGVALDEVPDRVRRLLWDLNGTKGQPGENWLKREVTGQHDTGAPAQTWTIKYAGRGDDTPKERRDKAATPEAEQWDGWGTALKPAHEPIVVARKPLAGTVAATVLEHGTGAMNIDGCRVGSSGATKRDGKGNAPNDSGWANMRGHGVAEVDAGRWPANFVLTHAPDCEQVGTTTERVGGGANATSGFVEGYERGDGFVGRHVSVAVWRCAPGCPVAALDEQSGDGASRFFTVTEWDDAPFRYVAKPSRAERNAGLGGVPKAPKKQTSGEWADGNFTSKPMANVHPTVKPLDLMRWLVRLVTPPGGVVLDPFAGSGTTLAAAILEGFDCVGVEMTDDYLPLIEGRCAWAEKAARFGPVTGRPKVDADDTPTLFDVEEAS